MGSEADGRSGMDTDLRSELVELRRLHAEAAAIVRGDDARIGLVVPAVSRWSAAQQIEHALRVNLDTLGEAEAAAAGGPARTTDRGLTPGGERVLAAGMIPRGLAEAPASYRASPAPTADALRDLVARHDALLARIEVSCEAFAASPLRLLHFALGGMTPAQWVRFGRIHLAHHLAIGREVVARG